MAVCPARKEAIHLSTILPAAMARVAAVAADGQQGDTNLLLAALLVAALAVVSCITISLVNRGFKKTNRD